MANILVINSSAAREDSISRILVDEVVTRLTEAINRSADTRCGEYLADGKSLLEVWRLGR